MNAKGRGIIVLIIVIIVLLSCRLFVKAEIQREPKPSRQCWHFNCWTYADGSVACDWEIETCDNRPSEFPVMP